MQPSSNNNDFESCFKNLADHIKKLAKSKTIIYIPNPGNFGDGLIRYASKTFMQEHSIQHIEINIGFRLGKLQLLQFLLKPNTFFIYGGGGAWHQNCTFGMRNCRFISKFTKHLLVLPSTYQLSTSGIRGTIYRRDNTYSVAAAPNSFFCHDMAFYLSICKETLNFPPACAPKALMLREDNESALNKADIPENNLDLSARGNHMSNGDYFLRQVSKYHEITTDRLHVCIAGALMGRNMNFIFNNYPKSKSIFKSSIQTFLPTVSAVEPKSITQSHLELSAQTTINKPTKLLDA